MEAEQVIDKILSDAKAEADKIAQQAREKAQAERARLDEQLAEFKQESAALAEKAAEDEKSHILAAARMEAAQEYLAEKTRILDEVFAQARRRLEQLPDNEYRDLMARLMREAVETGDEEVVIGRHETRIDQTLVDAVNGKLNAGGKGNLKLAAERANLSGGFLLRRGKIKTNVSIDVLLGQARNDLQIELAKDLFQKG
ncbi:MAG: V-type ATP synthase subunit E [Sedimentisphaerales bacterium]|nr:V-type ATP synthase subunit E [Sedimentisphaerales bacterium]